MFNLNQVMQMLPQFKQNPMSVLGKNFKLPEGMNNPQDMVNHLVNSGQINQQQFNQVRSTLQQMGFKF